MWLSGYTNYHKKDMEDKNMLVSAKDMLTKAKAGKYAVGQFNINNLEWTKAINSSRKQLTSNPWCF